MSTAGLDHAASFALWITIKASVLLGIAALAQAVTSRRTSAATRHMMWTLAIATVLALPLASLALPSWRVIARRVPPAVASELPLTRSPADRLAPDEHAVPQARLSDAEPAQGTGPEASRLGP